MWPLTTTRATESIVGWLESTMKASGETTQSTVMAASSRRRQPHPTSLSSVQGEAHFLCTRKAIMACRRLRLGLSAHCLCLCCLCRGHFVAGKPNGFGEYLLDAQSCTATGCWDEEGVGWARICYDGGLVYEGGCRDGKREGQVE